MSGEKEESGFLSRWARRKALAKDEASAPGPSEHEAAAQSGEPVTNAGEDASENAPSFDVSTLPTLEEINSQTNLTDFLRKEVPESLRNAAMKRAWALDPAIRDYVNPAMEYAFDWNVPGGVPGNGPLQAGFDAAKVVAQMFTTSPDAEAPENASPSSDTLGVGDAEKTAAMQSLPAAQSEPATPASVRRPGDEGPAVTENSPVGSRISQPGADAPQTTAVAGPADPPIRRPRHGGAAPT